MKQRERKSFRKVGISEDKLHAVKVARTTVVLPIAVDANLRMLALVRGESKGAIIKRAMEEFLEKNGYDPNKSPKINISY